MQVQFRVRVRKAQVDYGSTGLKGCWKAVFTGQERKVPEVRWGDSKGTGKRHYFRIQQWECTDGLG